MKRYIGLVADAGPNRHESCRKIDVNKPASFLVDTDRSGSDGPVNSIRFRHLLVARGPAGAEYCDRAETRRWSLEDRDRVVPHRRRVGSRDVREDQDAK